MKYLNYLKNWKISVPIALVILIVLAMRQKAMLEEKLANLKKWITNAADAKEWKASIEAYASKNALTYDEALDRNTRSALRKSEKFGFLL